MTSAEFGVLGEGSKTSARIQGNEIYVDLPVSAPVGEYELHAYESKNTVATIGFIAVFWMKSIAISFDCIIHVNP